MKIFGWSRSLERTRKPKVISPDPVVGLLMDYSTDATDNNRIGVWMRFDGGEDGNLRVEMTAAQWSAIKLRIDRIIDDARLDIDATHNKQQAVRQR